MMRKGQAGRARGSPVGGGGDAGVLLGGGGGRDQGGAGGVPGPGLLHTAPPGRPARLEGGGGQQGAGGQGLGRQGGQEAAGGRGGREAAAVPVLALPGSGGGPVQGRGQAGLPALPPHLHLSAPLPAPAPPGHRLQGGAGAGQQVTSSPSNTA